MMKFSNDFINIDTWISTKKTPDFTNIAKILKREKPSRPTLFEFIISNQNLLDALTQKIDYNRDDPLFDLKQLVDAYHIAGYDYACLRSPSFGFASGQRSYKASVSLNEGFVIHDRQSFEDYVWMEPEDAGYAWLDEMQAYMPKGMKMLVPGPDGVFETVLKLVGCDNLCFMLYDEPNLVRGLFDAVSSRYLRFYETCARHQAVGAMMSDDDWGFKTQTLLSVNHMREYVIPWHIKIAEAVHKAGKPVTLHSCGNIQGLMGDVIDKIKYDGWHSFEDTILPVEKAYEKYGGKIAILGGIDVDFLCRATPEQVYNRSCAMLDLSQERGGYGLGSGNSIPDYVPIENYLAMISAAVFNENLTG
ncbi:MAG: hypothetical protein FWE42_00375 [Defluviitaleaceae bacterium]|nr:hypothetical protein [Defluviitaleaceae bacterium]